MKVLIPDDFPDGPAYIGLNNHGYVGLVELWIYLSRFDTDAMPLAAWMKLVDSATSRLLVERELIAIADDKVRAMRGPTPRRARASEDPRFATWWAVWPRKQARAAAAKAFPGALRKIEFDALMAATRRYVEDPNREDAYTPHGATWLNGERWSDAPNPRRSIGRATAEDRVAAALEIGLSLSNSGRVEPFWPGPAAIEA
ncbi:hypothetical protein OG563_26860 [Nocardia vinacea]|uniref:Uncharacterized protein n=1 Tax=Nocardia vinacea TaxID=96468 RepID=A0ABZ1YIJ5_9NOCA|nr:hypothetical protein [Nocardia vinacea]